MLGAQFVDMCDSNDTLTLPLVHCAAVLDRSPLLDWSVRLIGWPDNSTKMDGAFPRVCRFSAFLRLAELSTFVYFEHLEFVIDWIVG